MNNNEKPVMSKHEEEIMEKANEAFRELGSVVEMLKKGNETEDDQEREKLKIEVMEKLSSFAKKPE